MSRLPSHLSDRTALLGSTAAALAGLPSHIIVVYVTARLVLPVGLIVYAAHGATPAQRIALVRDYLLGRPQPPARARAKPKRSKHRRG